MIDRKILALIFDVDNWAKDIAINNLNYPSITVEKNVVYWDALPEVCVADLLYNKHSKKYDKYPVVLNIHGGGWIIGNKDNSHGQCLQLADSGYFVVNINYGMPPKEFSFFEKHDPKASHGDYYFPAPIEHAYKALEWIKANAEKYNLDTEKVVVSGDSAGSHLTSVVCTSATNPEYRKALGLPDPACKIIGGVMFCGLYNYDNWLGMDINKVPAFRGMPAALFHNDKDPKSEPMYKYFNPIPFVTKDFPKALLVSGKFDVLTLGQTHQLADGLRKVGADFEHYEHTGPISIHDFHLLSFTPGSHNCMMHVAEFLDEVAAK